MAWPQPIKPSKGVASTRASAILLQPKQKTAPDLLRAVLAASSPLPSRMKRPNALAEISHNQRQPAVQIRPENLKASPDDVFMTMEQQTQSDLTQDSGISGLSSLDEDATDELGRRIVEAERQRRDQKRLRNAVSGNGQPFRLARPRSGIVSYVERFERIDPTGQDPNYASAESPIRDAEQPGGSGSDAATPPNIPRVWGTKGRRGADYLRRISTGDLGNSSQDVRAAQTSRLPRRALFTGDRTSAFEPDVPIPTTEPASPAKSSPSPSKPRSGHRLSRQNSFLDALLRREKGDSPASQSSPATHNERRVLDTIRQEEIDMVRDQGIATSRLLEEMGEDAKRNRALAFRKSTNTIGSILNDLNDEDSRLSPKRSSFHPIDDSPSQRQSPSPSPRKRPEIPPRTASRDLLKQLARASSATPSPPSRTRSIVDGTEGGSNAGRGSTLGMKNFGTNPLGSHPVNLDTMAKGTKVAKSTVSHRSTNVRAHLPTPPADDESHGQVLVDEAAVGNPSERVSSVSQTSLRHKVPAAQEDTHRVREHQPVRNNSGSTSTKDLSEKSVSVGTRPESVASFNNDLDNDIKAPGQASTSLRQRLSNTEDIDDEALDIISNMEISTTISKTQRPIELLAMQRMAKSLRSARAGLQDASMGMKRIEKEMRRAGNGPKDLDSHCPNCDRQPITLWTVVRDTVKVSLSSLFSMSTDSGAVRLTSLGIVLICFIVWSISELTLCELFCRPKYGYYNMVSYGMVYNAPRMPFVTITLLLRPFRWLWRPIVNALFFLWRHIFTLLARVVVGKSLQWEPYYWESAFDWLYYDGGIYPYYD